MKYNSASRIEKQYIKQLIEQISDQEIKNFVSNNLNWYLLRAKHYKAYYYILNIINVSSPILLVFINILFGNEVMIGQISVAVAGIVSTVLNSSSSIYEKKIIYRKAVEDIKRETLRYLKNIGEYKEETRDEDFIEKINDIINKVNNRWQEIEDKNNKSMLNDKSES